MIYYNHIKFNSKLTTVNINRYLSVKERTIMSLILIIIAIYIPLKIIYSIGAHITAVKLARRDKLRRNGFKPYKPSYGTYTTLNEGYALKKRVDRANMKRCLKGRY